MFEFDAQLLANARGVQDLHPSEADPSPEPSLSLKASVTQTSAQVVQTASMPAIAREPGVPDPDLPRFCQQTNLALVAFQLIEDAVIVTDLLGKVLFLNIAAERLTQWRSPEAYALPLTKVFPIFQESTLEPIVDPLLESVEVQGTAPEPRYALLIRQDHQPVAIEHSVTPFYTSQGDRLGSVVVFRDVSQSRQLACDLSWKVHHDALTGLMSRHSFEECLQQAVNSAKTLSQQHVLCYLDLDRFKVVNETCGHLAGNEVLRQVSALLQRRVRKTDILARLGGDDFGLILYQCDLEHALNVVHALREEVQNLRFEWEGRIFNFSISAGVVILNAESETASNMLSTADSACQAAKEKGRNRVQIYQPNDLDVTTQRGEIQWIPRIFKALEENQFLLYCQPIQPLFPPSSEPVENYPQYYEILLRLQDETGAIIAPGAFIPAAEKYDLMPLIDRWVIRTLFKRISQSCQDLHLDPAQNYACLYTINLSGATLNDDQFFEFVQEQFQHYGVPPKMICFEITETVAISNLRKTNELIQQLKAIGCRFALDDFGSGMSSFGYLKSLPIDYLKIDGIFVKEILQNQVACEIVEAINRIAHVMGIQTVAEFVETSEILQKLEALGIDYAQGYGISKPYALSVSAEPA